jgi:hypothetical protein
MRTILAILVAIWSMLWDVLCYWHRVSISLGPP